MSGKGRKQFLEAVAENQSIISYVKLFRMPLFLTVLDEELKKTVYIKTKKIANPGEEGASDF